VPEVNRRRLRVGCEFVHELSVEVPMTLQVEPRADAVIAVSSAVLETSPSVPVHHFTDFYGNRCARFVLGPGVTTIRYQAEVETTVELDEVGTGGQALVQDLPDDVLHFTLASRYCESDRLANVAWALFGGTEPGWVRTQAVVDWVHHNVTFEHGSSDSATTAADIFVRRRGVCRDFTHLAVALLRALNIPTRYCFGYLPDIEVPVADEPMDFAAWLECWLGDRWYTFDPRNNQRRTGRAVIGRGRDAADTAMLTTYGGAPLLAMRVVAEEASAVPWSSAHPPVVGQFPAPVGAGIA
jgi:transglutaminase-like putative cysteine protease